MAVEWSKIKAEYIADETTSYRELAKKYGVSKNVLAKKAGAEGWVDERQRAMDERCTAAVKAAEKKAAKTAEKLFDVADKILNRVEKLIDEGGDILVQPQSIKQLTGAVKDIKEILGHKTSRDIREQEARIRNLEKQAEADSETNEVRITIEGDADGYSV